MSKTRNTNIEIIRIISIVMIVISHYCVHGALNPSTMPLGLNRFLLEFFALGNLGSILFILISGYFMISSKGIKLKKLIRLILQVMFYSIIIYIIIILIKQEPFSIKGAIKNAFPITFKQYWFASAYIILYILSPFINKFLNSLSRKEHLIFISLLFFIFSILQTLTMMDFYGNELMEFLLFYSIGAYLFKYPNNLLMKYNIKISIVSIILIALSIICFNFLDTKIAIFSINSRYLLSRTSPLAILFCVGLFAYFIIKKSYSNNFINTISGLIFGVYLISDNNYIRKILWINIFNNAKYINSPLLILHMIKSVILTIVVCLIIEYIRKKGEEALFKYMDGKIDKFQLFFKKMVDRLYKRRIEI